VERLERRAAKRQPDDLAPARRRLASSRDEPTTRGHRRVPARTSSLANWPITRPGLSVPAASG